MHKIPRAYYNKDILDLLDEHIAFGQTSYSALEPIDQERITAACISVLGTDAYNCIIASENFEETLQHLQNYLLTSDREHAVELAQTMRKNATEHFALDMDLLFAERVYDQGIELDNEINHNLSKVVYPDNGEVRYV